MQQNGQNQSKLLLRHFSSKILLKLYKLVQNALKLLLIMLHGQKIRYNTVKVSNTLVDKLLYEHGSTRLTRKANKDIKVNGLVVGEMIAISTLKKQLMSLRFCSLPQLAQMESIHTIQLIHICSLLVLYLKLYLIRLKFLDLQILDTFKLMV